MSLQTVSTTGTCRCGQVAFEIHARPIITNACHCTGCQKMSSSAFSLTTLVPADSFEVTQGSPVIGGLHGASRHFFCPHCLSWLFTRPADTDAVIGVRSTLLENAQQFAPFMETWTSEKMPWAETGATHRFEKFPVSDAYSGLAALYAEHTAEAGSTG
jgi:hypothetical protein